MCTVYTLIMAQPFHLISIQLKRFDLEPCISRFGVPFFASLDKFDLGIAYLVHKWCVMTKKRKKSWSTFEHSTLKVNIRICLIMEPHEINSSIESNKKSYRISHMYWYEKTEDLIWEKKTLGPMMKLEIHVLWNR